MFPQQDPCRSPLYSSFFNNAQRLATPFVSYTSATRLISFTFTLKSPSLEK